MNEFRWLRRLGCGLAVLSLVSCGGGGGTLASSGGVGSGGTGISYGTVTGFGSIVLDGQAYSSATPTYFEDGAQGSGTLQPATAVELGDRLSVRTDASGNPTTVVIEPELIGTVGSVNASAGRFTVNGVTVAVNDGGAAGPTTYYAGLGGLAGLVAGTQVEVHGAFGLDSGGQPYVQATLVQQLPSTNQAVRITGLVSQLGASSFVVDGVTVNVSASTSLAPAGVALADGELVNVWSAAPIASNTVNAGAIRIRTLQGQSGQARIAGLVAQLRGTGFSVSGIPVDGSAVAASVGALHNGDYVVVQGSIDATSGTVRAASISGYASTIELKGTITGFVDASNFLLRGVPVDASAATFSGGSATSLGNGVYVEVSGTITSGQLNAVTANTVAVRGSAPDGGTADYRGTVSAVTSGGFTLSYSEEGVTRSITVTLASNVQYSNGAASALVVGATVEAEGTVSSNGLNAYSVSFVGAASGSGGSATSSSGSYETSGLVYNFDGSASTFVVNGLTIAINGVAVDGGALQNGVKVDVNFTQSGGVNLAQSISIDR
ncbi:hypothetical protein GALL_270730 [mine drainage metagenome]|uniref:DUF5666 domain-containing protein n=1 Tax=mine drainage metagenome TaxID=410659 RepID=A0A1J5R6G3_9ZZZZ